MDLGKYWSDVRAVMEKLPRQQIYYLVSIENADKGIIAGRVMDFADPKMVARRIVERTHILATEEQIAAHKVAQERQEEELAAIELKRKGQLAMPQELQDLVRLAARGVAPAAPAAPAPPPAVAQAETPKNKEKEK
jgi:hypothetical protein